MRRVVALITLTLLVCAPAAPAVAHEWHTLAPAQLKRTEVSAARIGNAIFVAGGFELVSGRSTDAVERYDLGTNRWTRRAPLPAALNHAAAAVYKGDLYIVGGYTDGDVEQATLYRYEPRKDRWTALAPMPTPRGALTAGVIGDRLYAAGGASDGTALTTLEVYSFKTGRWSPAPPMAVAREHLGGAVSGNAFYVLAGRAPSNLTVVERYVPAKRAWQPVPDVERARGGTAATTLSDGRIVIAGGEEAAGTIPEVELFDPRTRRWSALAAMPRPRHGLGVVARGRTVFTVQGGVRPGFSFSSALERLRVAPRT